MRRISAPGLVFLAGLLGGCPAEAPKPPPSREPPPHVLLVSLDRVSLRGTAWMELHTWLASVARGQSAAPPDLAVAAERYAAATRGDDADELLRRTAKALATCGTDACATKVLDPTPLGPAFSAALGAFEARFWGERSVAAQAGVAAARAALGADEIEPLLTSLADDLALTWSDPVIVDVVSEAPTPGDRALLPIALGARGSCFAKGAHEHHKEHGARLHDARIVDCVLAHAAVAISEKSRLFAALARVLPVPEAERAWELAVVHAAAATVTAWEPHHASVYRRAAEAVEPQALRWLADNWKWRAHGESVEAFGARYAEAFHGVRSARVAPKAPEPAQAPPAPAPSASEAAPAAPPVAPGRGACTRDDDCPVVMGSHQPCCLTSEGTGRCSGLPPRADACQDRHLCVSDADCRVGAKCKPEPTSGVKTCQGGKRIPSVLPGQCYSRPPDSPRMPECGDP